MIDLRVEIYVDLLPISRVSPALERFLVPSPSLGWVVDAVIEPLRVDHAEPRLVYLRVQRADIRFDRKFGVPPGTLALATSGALPPILTNSVG